MCFCMLCRSTQVHYIILAAVDEYSNRSVIVIQYLLPHSFKAQYYRKPTTTNLSPFIQLYGMYRTSIAIICRSFLVIRSFHPVQSQRFFKCIRKVALGFSVGFTASYTRCMLSSFAQNLVTPYGSAGRLLGSNRSCFPVSN